MNDSIVDVALSAGRTMRVNIIAPEILRLRLDDNGGFNEPSLVRYGVIENALQQSKAKIVDSSDAVAVTTSACCLTLDKCSGALRFSDANGKMLVESGKAPWSSAAEGFGAELKIGAAEKFYGLGDETRERINKRGHIANIWVRNVACYSPATVLFSTCGWGLFVNSTWRQCFDVGATVADLLRFGGAQGQFDIFLLAGKDLAALIERYTWLAGRPAMLPQWAYGLNYVCNQDVDARGMMEDCLNFRREGIPCDMVGLEPGWMSQHYDVTVDKKWHPQRFYMAPWAGKRDNFTGAVEHLGFKLSLWLCCDYDLSWEEERQAGKRQAALNGEVVEDNPDDFEKDEHFGHTPILMDKITKPEEAWFDHLKKFVDQGARAFKMDGAFQVNEHPDRHWGNGMTDEEMHNMYPVLLNKQMSQGYTGHTGQRSMIYSSGGFNGIQRFAATWAGDTGGGSKVLTSILNHGLSGHSNASCDMEGFTNSGIHFGFFQPWSQLNNWAYWRQPWFLPEEQRRTFKFYANLRYRLLPYIYTMAHVANATGMPVMRALPMVYPDDPAGENITNEYMFGDSFLSTAFNNQVHLPAGTWYDFWTGKKYVGPLDFAYELPPDRGGALFVKAGAIIPMAPEMAYVGQRPLTEVELHVYPGPGSASFAMYEDDGVSFEYLNGKYAETRVCRCESGGKVELTIAPRCGEYAGMPSGRSFKVIFHDAADCRDWQLDGHPVTTVYDPATAQTTIAVTHGTLSCKRGGKKQGRK